MLYLYVDDALEYIVASMVTSIGSMWHACADRVVHTSGICAEYSMVCPMVAGYLYRGY